jgi:hypothetical protein
MSQMYQSHSADMTKAIRYTSQVDHRLDWMTPAAATIAANPQTMEPHR